MNFQASFNGKIVSYPIGATFHIDQRKPGKQYIAAAGNLQDIHQAVHAFHRLESNGLITRLVCSQTKKTLMRS